MLKTERALHRERFKFLNKIGQHASWSNRITGSLRECEEGIRRNKVQGRATEGKGRGELTLLAPCHSSRVVCRNRH